MLAIGIDQSYTRTGISIAKDNNLVKIYSIDLKRIKSKTEKRREVINALNNIIIRIKQQWEKEDIVIICERIRTFTTSTRQFLNLEYIKSTAALVACIIDLGFDYNIPVYSVDTRSWKKQVLGSSKSKGSEKNSAKTSAISFIKNLGFDNVNDDMADSACIALYFFSPNKLLKLEQ